MTCNRRLFLGSLAGLAAAWRLSSLFAAAADSGLHIAGNQYPWFTYYQREGRDWNRDPDAGLADVARSGLQGFEPLLGSADQVKQLAPLLKKHNLEMQSLYINVKLHDKADVQEQIQNVLAIAKTAHPLGTRFLVINPTPLAWGGPNNKTDAQIELQAGNLDRLGAELRKQGQVLSYHFHEPEFRCAAREFHHMMLGTDPRNVTLCLDAHWVFRGASDSQVALFDIVKLYGPRISELHLRQSSGGVWTETFGSGDIDYPRLAAELVKMKIRPHVVLEQAAEAKTPKTMGAVEAHQKGVAYTRKVFAALGRSLETGWRLNP